MWVSASAALATAFMKKSLRCAVQMLILDFFDFHARIYGEDSVSTRRPTS